MDPNCDYWQVEIAGEDHDKTAFTFQQGSFHFTRLQFALKNASGMFQSAIDVVLKKVKWQYALVYLDDVVKFSQTPDKHIEHFRQVLTLLNDVGVTLNLKK